MNPVYRIVVGVDGSDAGQCALEWAAEECIRRNGSLAAVTAWHPDHLLDNVVISAENADPQRFAHEIIAEAVAAARTVHPGLHITASSSVAPRRRCSPIARRTPNCSCSAATDVAVCSTPPSD
jgi:nucleotide-binding universal stress UspA family protein